jgi:Ca2+-transporting ATPase
MGTSDLEARTLSFATLVFANLMLIITNLSWKNNLIDILRTKNQALWCVALGAIVALSLVIYLPILRELFHFSILHLNDLTICLLGAAVSLVWFEVLKFLRKNSA